MNVSHRMILILLALVLSLIRPNAAVAAQSGVAPSPSTQPTQAALLSLPPGEGPVDVRVAFHLRDINEIDDEAETFEFTGVLTLSWLDPRLAFDPESVGATELIFQGSFQFNEISPAWYPQVVLANESGMYEKTAVILRVEPDGRSTLIETVNAVAEVNLGLRRYPFDTQRLEAVFEILGFDSNEVALRMGPAIGTMDGVPLRIPQWHVGELRGMVRDEPAPYLAGTGACSAFVLTIEVTRSSLFTLRLVVIPLMLMVALSWSVFWMDQSAVGDRMSVSFVGVLTAVAYQVVLSDILPRISYVTLINVFLNVSFFLMCASVVVNLRVGLLVKRGQAERGVLVDRRARWMFPAIYGGTLAIASLLAFALL